MYISTKSIFGHRVDLLVKKPATHPGRGRTPKKAKLTDDQVRAARKSFESYGAQHRTIPSLAAEYGVSESCVSAVVQYINRRNVK